MIQPKKNKMYEKNDYRHLGRIRVLERSEYQTEDNQDERMIVEGKAITYDDPTVLFEWDGIEYKEVIEKGAFFGADLKDAFFKYNHTDSIMAMARFKNGTLQFDERDDGVYIRAELANTTAGRDLYELIKRGDIDKMSFAFSIEKERYDELNTTWYVEKIKKIWDVAAVPVPAYENTQIFARRLDEVEALRAKEVEALNAKKNDLEKRTELRTQAKEKIDSLKKMF